jgi:hypothetical protein
VSVQYSVTLRNSQLDLVESTTGAAALLRLYSGSVPADCAAAASGTLLCTITLPSDWMNAASAGAKTLLGTWSGTGDAGAGSGTAAGYFRVLDSSGVTTHLQGTVTVTGGGGDLTVDNTSIASAQLISISAFTITALNA